MQEQKLANQDVFDTMILYSINMYTLELPEAYAESLLSSDPLRPRSVLRFVDIILRSFQMPRAKVEAEHNDCAREREIARANRERETPKTARGREMSHVFDRKWSYEVDLKINWSILKELDGDNITPVSIKYSSFVTRFRTNAACKRKRKGDLWHRNYSSK